MAKTKNQKFKVDDFGFSSDLDIPDFNFAPEPVKDDRTPVTKMAKSFGKGALDTAKSPSFIRNTIKKSMPTGYGEAMDLTGQAGDGLKQLYDTAATELKPVIRDAKRLTRKLQPLADSKLPKSIADKMRKWAKDEQQSAQESRDQQRDAGISMQLGDIFKMQTELSQQEAAKREVQSQVSESFTHKRHLDQMSQLDSMRVSLQQIANYQGRIESAWQKKSLELQFRHYFVAADSLEEQKRMNALMTTELAGIKKNTGLPEFTKIKTSERFWEVTRNKFANSMEQTLLSKPRAFVQQLSGKLAKRVKESAANFGQNLQMGLSGVDSAMEMREMEKQMAEMMGEAPESLKEKAAGLAGGAAATGAGGWLGKKLRKYTSKSPTLMKGSNQLSFLAQNAPQLGGQFAKGDSLDWVPGMRMLKETIQDILTPDNRVGMDQAGSMQDPDVFSRQTNKSVTEVIPGFLARIYRELKIIRTGDEGQKLVTYDFTANRFSDSDSVAKNIFKKIVSDYDKSSTKFDIDGMFKQLDPDGTRFSPEERKALGHQLLKDNLNNELADPERLKDSFSYRGEASRHASKFADFFTEYFGDDPLHEKKLKFSQQYNKLGSGVNLSRKTIQDFVNTGNRDELEKAGILRQGTDSIDMDKLLQYYMGEEYETLQATAQEGVSRGGGAMGRAARRGRRGQSATSLQVGGGGPALVGQPQSVQADPTVLSEILSSMRETGKASVTGLDSVNATLMRIEQQLMQGIAVYQEDGTMKVGNGRIKGLMNRMAAGMKSSAEKGKHWWNNSVVSNASGLISAARRGVNRGVAVGIEGTKQGFKFGGWAAGKLGGLLGGAKDQAFGLFGKARDHMRRLKDVYIEGEVKPRLHAWGIKAGEYRDAATGKVITSYKDIKGAVIDKYGNEIMSAHDAAKAFVKDGVRMRSLKAMGWVAQKSKDMAGSVLGRIPPNIRAFLSGVKNNAVRLLDPACDVYVAGKKDPVLLARVMREGGYVRQDGSAIIYRPGQINGAVLDIKGNVMVSQQEFELGLYDVHGKKLKTIAGRLLRAGSNVLAVGKRVALSALRTGTKMASFAWDKTKQVAGTMWDATKRALNIDQKAAALKRKMDPLDPQQLMIRRLTEIRNILRDRLGGGKKASILGDSDGDGVRDGSYKDWVKKQKDRLSGLAGRGKDAAGEFAGKAGGALGGLGGALAGLLGKGKAAAGEAAASGGGLLSSLSDWLGIAGGLAATKTFAGKALGGLKTRAGSAMGGLGNLLGRAGGAFSGMGGTLSRGAGAATGALASAKGMAGSALGSLGKGAGGIGAFLKAITTGGWGGAGKLLKGGLASAGGGFLADWAAGKMGAGGNHIDDISDNNNWNEMNWWQKLQSGGARGIEKAGGLFFLDNLANEARAKRIKAESEYLRKKKEEDTGKPGAVPAPAAPSGGAAAAVKAAAPVISATGMPAAQKPATESVTIKGEPIALTLPQMNQKPVDALTALRFKAYGLQELDADKVAAIRALEAEVATGLTYEKGAANWTGSREDLLDRVGVRFGKKSGVEFLNWVQGRFMPVFLSFAGAVSNIGGSKDPIGGAAALAPAEAFEVARVVMSAKSPFGGSVWGISVSPWEDYSLSDSDSVAQGNMDALQADAKLKGGGKVKDPTAKANEKSENKPKANSMGDGKSETTQEALAGKAPSFMESLKDRVSKIWEGTKSLAKDMAGGAKALVTDAYQGVKSAVTGSPSASLGASPEVTHPGNGTGGDVNSLPQPKGDGSAGALRELIEAASKMAGVDPKLMMTMAAIESGFRSTVKAGTSSATGLYQFISGTWSTMLKKYGAKYGIAPGTSPTDPRANALMGAEFIKENLQAMKAVVNRPLTATDAYAAHFLGAGGARQLLRAEGSANAVQLMPEAAGSNRSIFYNPDGSPRTVAQVYSHLNNLVVSKGKAYGLDTGGVAPPPESQAAAPAAAAGADTTAAVSADQKRSKGGYAGSVDSSGKTIPVANQQAGATPPGTAGASTPTAANAPSRAGMDPAVSAAGAGFSPQARTVQATQQYQRELSAESFAPMTDVLKDTLGVNREQLTALNTIIEVLKAQGGSTSAAASDTLAGNAQSSVQVKPQPRAVPESPVPMTKRSFSV